MTDTNTSTHIPGYGNVIGATKADRDQKEAEAKARHQQYDAEAEFHAARVTELEQAIADHRWMRDVAAAQRDTYARIVGAEKGGKK